MKNGDVIRRYLDLVEALNFALDMKRVAGRDAERHGLDEQVQSRRNDITKFLEEEIQ